MNGPEKDALSVLQPFLGEELAKDIISHRRGLKAPLTGRGAKALVREYMSTGDAVAAAEHHLNMGWRGFSADWMKPKGRGYHDAANPAPRGDMASFTRNMMEQMNGQSTMDDGRDASPQFALGFSSSTGRGQRH